jgi:hypothetical protein
VASASAAAGCAGGSGSRFSRVVVHAGVQLTREIWFRNMRFWRSIRFRPSSPFNWLRASVWVTKALPVESTATP